jgi:glutamyl-tRNA reductase
MNDIQAISEVCDELAMAVKRYPSMKSAHEGYAVILEEVDELWDEVKKRPALRSIGEMRAEAKQIAAMAIRFMMDLT